MTALADPVPARRVFVAGATGAIGARLVPLLVARGHCVFGTTRSAAKAPALLAHGAEVVVVDAFDRAALTEALARARPEVVVHLLTDLPRGLDPSRMAEGIARNSRMRREGTANLVAAAVAAGARRMVAQSIAWAYAPGVPPYGEEAPLDTAAEGLRAVSIGGVIALEHAVLGAAALQAVLLRYGHIHGPGTGANAPGDDPLALHVDAAAWAACLAVERDVTGIYNIAAATAPVDSRKARRDLGWREDLRLAG